MGHCKDATSVFVSYHNLIIFSLICKCSVASLYLCMAHLSTRAIKTLAHSSIDTSEKRRRGKSNKPKSSNTKTSTPDFLSYRHIPTALPSLPQQIINCLWAERQSWIPKCLACCGVILSLALSCYSRSKRFLIIVALSLEITDHTSTLSVRAWIYFNTPFVACEILIVEH